MSEKLKPNSKTEEVKDQTAEATRNIIYGATAAKLATELLYKNGVLPSDAYSYILNALEPLQHVTNSLATLFIMGAVMASAEYLRAYRESRTNQNESKYTHIAPVVGAVAAIAFNVAAESVHLTPPGIPLDTLDPIDAAYGIATIAPGYFVAKRIWRPEARTSAQKRFKN